MIKCRLPFERPTNFCAYGATLILSVRIEVISLYIRNCLYLLFQCTYCSGMRYFQLILLSLKFDLQYYAHFMYVQCKTRKIRGSN